MDQHIVQQLLKLGMKPKTAQSKSKNRKAQQLKKEFQSKYHQIKGGKAPTKRKPSAYNIFVKKMRLQGHPMKTIGLMWRQGKAQGGSKFGNWVKKMGQKAKSLGQKVGRALRSDKVKQAVRYARNTDLLKNRIPDKVHNMAQSMGYGRPKRKQTEYNRFVKKLRLQGYSLKEISKLWKEYKSQL